MKARRNSADEWVPLQRAVRELELSREAVLRLCITGDLTGEIRDSFVFIRRDTLAQYKKQQAKAA